MSKILILSGSPRRNGNTELLAEAFAKGAKHHHEVEVFSIMDHTIHPCVGRNTCFDREGHTCCQKDDMHLVYEKLKQAEILVIASPVYFYGISAQLKAVIDRLHTPMREAFSVKKLALLLVGAATLPELFDSILTQYHLILNFFRLEDAGTVLVSGAKDKGDVRKGDALERACQLGESL